MALSTNVHDLRALIRSSHPLAVIETVEEESVRAQNRMLFDKLRRKTEDRFVSVR